MAEVSVSFAPWIFSGFPCDVVRVYPETIIMISAIPPERLRRIERNDFVNPAASVGISPKAVEIVVQFPDFWQIGVGVGCVGMGSGEG